MVSRAEIYEDLFMRYIATDEELATPRERLNIACNLFGGHVTWVDLKAWPTDIIHVEFPDRSEILIEVPRERNPTIKEN